MLPPTDSRSFGQAIAQVRNNQGLSQKEVAGRLHTYYSDESSYRRIENGRRCPDRDSAIAILVQGLRLTDLERINSVLALARYDGLSADEAARLHLQQTEAKHSTDSQHKTDLWNRTLTHPWFKPVGIGLAFGSILLSLWIASRLGESLFPAFTSMMYALLFVLSLLLESAYEFNRARVLPAAIFTLCFMFSTSVAALALDAWGVSTGKTNAMWGALPVFLSAATLQWLIVRPALPSYTIVKTTYESHTAQAAHLKNTAYFLFIVVPFWLPPFHCVSVLRREVRIGHTSMVRELLGHWFLVGRGILCLSVGGLCLSLLAMIVAALLMRGRLLDNLEPDPVKNSYTTLFYARALVYFTLCVICISWYADSISFLLPQ